MIEQRTSTTPIVIEDTKTSWTDGFFKIKKLNLSLPELRTISTQVGATVKHRYGNREVTNGYKNQTTNLFAEYNIFMFSAAPLHALFKEINTFWNEIKPNDDVYYLQSWLNVYDSDESIGWHYHWSEKFGAYHGFFCVDVADSRTSYVLSPRDVKLCKAHDYVDNGKPVITYNDEYDIVDVHGQDNLLIVGPSAGDMHRNVPWDVKGRPRITIAFDIVPGRFIDNAIYENHWIPLV